MSTDYIEWNGTDRCLEALLIWWATREPFEHTDECTQPDNTLHCCEGKEHENSGRYSFQSTGGIPKRVDDYLIPIEFNDDGVATTLDVGDRIYYRGNWVFELVKNA